MSRRVLKRRHGLLWALGVAVGVLLTSYWLLQCPAGAPAPAPGDAASDLMVGEPIRCQNLAIFPVLSKVAHNEDRFITLDEGLKAKTVEVCEVGAVARRQVVTQGADSENRVVVAQGRSAAQNGQVRRPANAVVEEVAGDVNHLLIVNRSGRPLYLMPGEIIIGGKQDRTIGDEMIIQSGDKPVSIAVYCVEHGRWSGRGAQETAVMLRAAGATAEPVAAERLAKDARSGKFIGSAGSLNQSARRAVQEGKGQTAVWDEVGAANDRSGAKTASGAFTANYADASIAKRLAAYTDALAGAVREQRQVVGVVVAINGKVQAADVFESTPLFAKLWTKLLKSYAWDAAMAATAGESKTEVSCQEARQFMTKSLQASVRNESSGTGGLVVTHRESDDVVSFSAKAAPAAGAASGMGGAMDGVHSSAYRK